MRCPRVTLTALLLVSGLPPAAVRAEPRPVERYDLSNGLRVLLAPEPERPFAYVSVSYSCGRAQSPPHRRHLAHVVEHLVFEPTRRRPRNYFEAAAAIGGRLSGTTHSDHTQLALLVPPESLEAALWLEAERLAFAVSDTDEAALERAIEAVAHEQRTKLARNPLAVYAGQLQLLVWPRIEPLEPAPLRLVPSPELSLREAKSFMRACYRPDNAVLAVGGRFEPPAARRAIATLFEPVPNPHGERSPPLSLLAPEPERRELEVPGSKHFVFYGWHLAPQHRAPHSSGEDDAAALFAAIVQSQWSERVLEFPRVKVWIGLVENTRGGSLLVLGAQGYPKHTAARLEKNLARAVERIRTQGIGAFELVRARRQLEREHHDQQDALRSRIDELMRLEHLTGGAQSPVQRLGHFDQVTADDLGKWLTEHLDISKASVTVLRGRDGRRD